MPPTITGYNQCVCVCVCVCVCLYYDVCGTKSVRCPQSCLLCMMNCLFPKLWDVSLTTVTATQRPGYTHSHTQTHARTDTHTHTHTHTDWQMSSWCRAKKMTDECHSTNWQAVDTFTVIERCGASLLSRATVMKSLSRAGCIYHFLSYFVNLLFLILFCTFIYPWNIRAESCLDGMQFYNTIIMKTIITIHPLPSTLSEEDTFDSVRDSPAIIQHAPH